MIKVKFYTQNKNYVGVECKGHADFAEYGKDVICAGVSSLVQSTALGLMKVLNLDIQYKIDERKGTLEFRLPNELSKTKFDKTQILMETLYLSLRDFESGYPSNIKVEVKDLCL